MHVPPSLPNIIGLGHDIVHITRIEALMAKHHERFLERILTPTEQIRYHNLVHQLKKILYVAKRFAAKEACAKAFGTGIGKDLGFQDITIGNHSSGQPILALSEASKHLLAKRYNCKDFMFFISLADDYPIASATVIITALP